MCSGILFILKDARKAQRPRLSHGVRKACPCRSGGLEGDTHTDHGIPSRGRTGMKWGRDKGSWEFSVVFELLAAKNTILCSLSNESRCKRKERANPSVENKYMR